MTGTLVASWGIAGAAGVATVASPCVLPLLPLLLGMTAGQTSRWRPLTIVTGFVLSFVALALVFGASAQVLGLSPQTVRQGAAAVLLLAGLSMLWPAVSDRLLANLNGIGNLAHRLGARAGDGAAGGLLLGATLGALWTPCAGPVLAAILALVADAGTLARAWPLLLAYTVGAGLPMLAMAYGGQALTTRLRPLARHTHRIRQGFGVLVMATAAAMLAQVDAQASAWLSRAWSGATSFNPGADTFGADTTVAAPGEMAPDFVGIDQWLNSPPLNLAGLRGKVVLVDFWTHGCVNCIRTLPHLRRLHERHASQGLVVVGVHTPEFAFERSTDNVRAAIRRHGIAYPVAQDNRYQTWKAYRNAYWPAVYLIDREGRIVFRHFGEGNERAIDQAVERALGPTGVAGRHQPGAMHPLPSASWR